MRAFREQSRAHGQEHLVHHHGLVRPGERVVGVPPDRVLQLLLRELRGVVLALLPLAGPRRLRGRHLVLHPAHHQVRSRLAVLVDRVLVAVQPLVDRAQVEVDLGISLGELERLQEGRLRVLQPVQLEVDQAEVVVEDVGVGALRHQLAVDLLRLLQLVLPEVDEAQQVEHPLVARTEQVGLLQLPLRGLVLLGVVEVPALVEVGEEQPLIERPPRDGVGHG